MMNFPVCTFGTAAGCGASPSAAAFAGVSAMAPTAHADYTLIKLCVTLQPRGAAVTVNGTPILGSVVPGFAVDAVMRKA